MECLIKEIDELPINDDPVTSEEVTLELIINNVTSSFSAGCKIDYKKVPSEYQSVSITQMTKMKVEDCTIVIRNSGKLLCMGASSEEQARLAARKSIEVLKSWGFDATFCDFRVLSLFCSCLFPWRIRIEAMVAKYPDDFMYEPEIHNYCMLKVKERQGFFGIYPTGFIRAIGHTVEMILNLYERALPHLSEFRI